MGIDLILILETDAGGMTADNSSRVTTKFANLFGKDKCDTLFFFMLHSMSRSALLVLLLYSPRRCLGYTFTASTQSMLWPMSLVLNPHTISQTSRQSPRITSNLHDLLCTLRRVVDPIFSPVCHEKLCYVQIGEHRTFLFCSYRSYRLT